MGKLLYAAEGVTLWGVRKDEDVAPMLSDDENIQKEMETALAEEQE